MFFLAALTVVAGPVASACSGSRAPDEPAAKPAVDMGMTLFVDNHNLLDMRVFLLTDGDRQKIGTVPSMTKRIFRVSEAELGGALELRLLADPIGSRDSFSSQPIPVQAGAIIEWQVEKDIRFSSILLR